MTAATADCINLKPGETDVAQKVINNAIVATVQIHAVDSGNNSRFGTGFLVGQNGHVVTNFHVIRGAAYIEIAHHNSGRFYERSGIRVAGTDPIKDLALLKIAGLEYGNGVGTLDLTGCYDSSVTGTDYVLVANTTEFRNFATKGNVGGAERITEFLPQRLSLDFDGTENPYDYTILLFRNEVIRGNSGAAVLRADNGKLIGVLAGAIGSGEYASFAVPIEHALRLFQTHAGEPGHEVADFAESPLNAVDQADPYYAHVRAYSNDLNSNLVSVSGNVVEYYTEGGIGNARVTIFEESLNLSYTQVTDVNGSYGFQVPGSPHYRWKMRVSHQQYNPHFPG